MSTTKATGRAVLPALIAGLVCGLHASPAPPGGPQEGIKVHGHWTIEVRNPDGTLVSRTEFKNALEEQGRVVLALVLGSYHVVGPWEVTLGGPGSSLHGGTGPCDFNGLAAFCSIIETGAVYAGKVSSHVFPNLTRAHPVDPVSGFSGTLELSGTATAAHPFNVSRVTTAQWMCNDHNMSSPDCKAGPGAGHWIALLFTARDLPNPVSVVPGQIIQVKVVISFS